jgi:hypothetical protein
MLTMEIEMDDSTMQKAARTARPGALERTTGRDRQGWFAVLDEWGAAGRPYREIADWLTGEHGLSDWWAQKLIVEYEEARGVRAAGVRRDGTFEVGASKVINVDIERVRAAFVDPTARERWLRDARLQPRDPSTETRLRFDWADGSRIVVNLVADADRTQVAIQHERLPDADTAARVKAFWRERMADLKAYLEVERHDR